MESIISILNFKQLALSWALMLVLDAMSCPPVDPHWQVDFNILSLIHCCYWWPSHQNKWMWCVSTDDSRCIKTRASDGYAQKCIPQLDASFILPENPGHGRNLKLRKMQFILSLYYFLANHLKSHMLHSSCALTLTNKWERSLHLKSVPSLEIIRKHATNITWKEKIMTLKCKNMTDFRERESCSHAACRK